MSNRELVGAFLEKLKGEKTVSQSTLKTYTHVANSLPFSLLLTQGTVKRKLKELYSNPNTLSLYLNIIILIRRHNDEPVDRLILLRNSLKESIAKTRKDKLDEMDETLPSLGEIEEKLDEMEGVPYIVNHLMLRGLRNKDINLTFVKKLPKETEQNLIAVRGKKATLMVGDYKTDKQYGTKTIIVEDPKFVSELKKLKLTDKEALLKKRDGTPIETTSTLNDKLLGMSAMKLGQNRIIKAKIKSLLKANKFDKLEQITKDRGTSLQVLLRSYNLLNGNKYNEPTE